jgi:hypothetical protein
VGVAAVSRAPGRHGPVLRRGGPSPPPASTRSGDRAGHRPSQGHGHPAPGAADREDLLRQPGSDKGANTGLDAEYADLRSTTQKTQTITGWTLHDAAEHVCTVPATTIAAGTTVRVHTGKGSTGTAHRYWGRTPYVWNDDRDTATLRTTSGVGVDVCAYDSTRADSENCGRAVLLRAGSPPTHGD